jgi:hypothetical protein
MDLKNHHKIPVTICITIAFPQISSEKEEIEKTIKEVPVGVVFRAGRGNR